MAIFHLTAKVISRGKGQSAIAAAAYRSGERLYDEQSAMVKYYPSREERIIFTDIMAPKDAPEWAHDRDQLWNHAERAEKRKDAQLAREIEIALPHELTDQQRLWLVKDFAREAFVRKGYVVDIAIHAPDKTSDDRNFHAHLMVTRRTVGPEGLAATKDWQFDPTQLEGWREQWEHLANRHLERHGHSARIDRRSLKEQGIDREPTVHVGYAASEMTQRGVPSDRMDLMNEILARNEIRVDLAAMEAELKTLENEQAKQQKKAADDRLAIDRAAAERKASEASQQRALELASAARRRQRAMSQMGRSQPSKPVPQPDRAKSAAHTTTEQKPANVPQQTPPAPQIAAQVAPAPSREIAHEQKPATHAAQPAPAHVTPTTPDREGYRWSEAWGFEKVEDIAAAKKQQEAAAKQPAPVREQEVAPSPTPEKAKAAQPERQPAPSPYVPSQWGMTFQHAPQGNVPVVPIEDINARHGAAERERARAEAVKQTQLERAASQEEVRQRFERNHPYDQSRHRLSPGQQKQQDAWQERGGVHGPNKLSQTVHVAAKESNRAGLRVLDKTTGAVFGLADFVTRLLASPSPQPEPPTDMRAFLTDPAARRAHERARLVTHYRAEREAQAFESIAQDMEAGRYLKPEDIAALPRTVQEQMVAKGDDYTRQVVDDARRWANTYWKEQGRDHERE